MSTSTLTSLFNSPLLSPHGDSRQRLEFVVDMMRDLSAQTDPQLMVKAYGQRMRQVFQSDANFSLSRRDLQHPYYRITRSSRWEDPVNPWKSRDVLPVLAGGRIAELLYGDEPVIIDDLQAELGEDEPAIEYLRDMGSLLFIPLYHDGAAINGVVILRKQANAFSRETLPEHVWMGNLFGRATHSLVLSQEVRKAYDVVDRELRVVADIQRSLLPTTLPDIPTLELAAHYETSMRAGGDYYDFFSLPDGKWGILVADVSGHGTPAAVIMAVTHSIAHMLSVPPIPPSRLLTFVNRHLAARYTGGSGTFVTAFYGIYDPATRTLSYASAGHPPARINRCGDMRALDGVGSLPLGIDGGERYEDSTHRLEPGDCLIIYTDGITETKNPQGDFFGEERLDQAACCQANAPFTVQAILAEIDRFRMGRALADDRTLLVARVV